MASNIIEVFIETLHGTAFELLVSPADTVVSIKSRISRLEGIPVSQQHLIWQSQELPDESSLRDFNITDGSTLKLVLGMRVGPINTRKASVEERPSLLDVAKYLEAKGDELSLGSARLQPVTVVVVHDGDQVHLYTLVNTLSKSGRSSASSDSLSEDSTKELRGEDIVEEISHQRENMEMRQKVALLQKKLKAARRKKEGTVSHEPDSEEEAKVSQQNQSKNRKEPPLRLPPLAPTRRASLCASNGSMSRRFITCTLRRAHRESPAVECCANKMSPRLPESVSTRPPPGSGMSKPQELKSSCAVPRCLGGGDGAANALGGNSRMQPLEGQGLSRRSRDIVVLAASLPSSMTQWDKDTDDNSPPATGHRALQSLYKVLPPVTHHSRDVVPEEQEVGVTEQEVSSPPLVETTPLELDPWDCPRPKTAPPRVVRLSVVQQQANSSPVSSSCSPKDTKDSNSAGTVGATHRSALQSGADVRWIVCPQGGVPKVLGVVPSDSNILGKVTGLRGRPFKPVQTAADDESEDKVPASQSNGQPEDNNKHFGNSDANASNSEQPSASNAPPSSHPSPPATEEQDKPMENGQQLPPLKAKKKMARRCDWCKRKTGLASTYVCRCGKSFCAAHRYAEVHRCSHDYRTEGRHILQRSNPVVKASKVHKI
ncbi:uncharacterized protein LOC135368171 [Ornithodoros turicata]